MQNNIANLIGKKVLVTFKDFFIAPNGRQYKAVTGEFKGAFESDSYLCVPKSRNHANWFFSVGSFSTSGCNFLSIIEVKDGVDINLGEYQHMDDSGKEHKRFSLIYEA